MGSQNVVRAFRGLHISLERIEDGTPEAALLTNINHLLNTR